MAARAGGAEINSVADVDSPAITDLHRRIGKSGKQRSANKLISLLRVIFNASGRRAGNPGAGLKLYRETPRSRRLTPDEAKRLRAVLAEERQHRDAGRAMIAVFCWLAYLTGARRSSLSAMRWDDLDLRLGQETWVVPANWSKNSTELAVAVTEAAATILTAWRERCPSRIWVFPSRDSRSGHLFEPKKGWERIRRTAGIGDITLHDLRRSLGSEVAAAGGNAATIAAALGHPSLQSAKAYLHLNVGEVRRALEGLDRHG